MGFVIRRPVPSLPQRILWTAYKDCRPAVAFIAAKSKVTPLVKQSIPRLELNAASGTSHPTGKFNSKSPPISDIKLFVDRLNDGTSLDNQLSSMEIVYPKQSRDNKAFI